MAVTWKGGTVGPNQWATHIIFCHKCENNKKVKASLGEDAEKKHDRKTNVLNHLKSRTSKLTLLYLNFIIPLFDEYNLILQTEDPRIHREQKILKEFVKEIMVMFVAPSAMVYKSVTDVDLSSLYNFKASKDIVVGQAVRDYIKSSKLNDKSVDEFYKSVKNCLFTAVKYLLKNLPLQDLLLNNASVADMAQRDSARFGQLEYFIKPFPVLLPADSWIGGCI